MIKWKYKPSGNCPVQAEGHFLGYYFYFRARHTQAIIEFSKTEAGWQNDLIHAKYILATVPYPMAGWMPEWKCRLLIWIGCFIFALKPNKNKTMSTNNNTPIVSDDFQIGPDGAYEHTEWDATLMDGLHDEEFPDFETKPGFVERRMAQGRAINNGMWDKIYQEYSGVSDLHDFIDWLKQNYIAPEKI